MGFLSQTYITQGFESPVKKNSVRLSVLEILAGDLTAYGFSAELAVGSPVPEPLTAYDPGRRQFLSTAVLEAVLGERRAAAGRRKGRATKAERALGVIDRDLCVPHLNFVFGTARRKGAVISLTRLRESFYGRMEDEGLFRRRVRTEAEHELGHTFGLGHCPDAGCVMFFSNSLGDTDRKGPGFCLLCKARFRTAAAI
jgi:archaemetzincin